MPLMMQPVQVVVKTVNFEAEFISRMIPKLEWSVLKAAAESVRTALRIHMFNFNIILFSPGWSRS